MLKKIAYNGLSRRDIEGDYLLRQVIKGELFCLVKKLSEKELELILKELYLLGRILRVSGLDQL